MGFFGFLRKEEKTYGLDEALEVLQKKFDAQNSARKEEMYVLAGRLMNEFLQLKTLIEEFERKPIAQNARSSSNVKERFCSIAIDQISGMTPPDKNRPMDFIQSARRIFHGLGGLTERQLLHMGVFFSADIEHVSRKMKEINMLLQTKEDDKGLSRALALSGEIKEIEATIPELKEKLKSLEKSELVLKNKLPERREFHVDNSSVVVAERKLARVKQEIDSLLSVQKMLRKYAHDKNIRDDLLEKYLDSPSTAILQDNHFRIIKMVQDARAFDDTGKAESVVSKEHIVRAKREELLEALNDAEKAKREFERQSSEAAAGAMELKRKSASIEAEIKETSRSALDAREELDKMNSALAAKKTELYLLASDILNAKVI